MTIATPQPTIARIPDAAYFEAPGLSHSGMKDLAVSPLRFWHRHINPNREVDEPTAEMRFGTAVHCAVLEPKEFDLRYCCEPDQDEHPGLLVTKDDLSGWLKDKGLPVSGRTKDDLIDRVMAADAGAPIWDVICAAHDDKNSGKIQFKRGDWLRIAGAADALRSEPHINRILDGGGAAEMAIFAKDPRTGTSLKGKLDWIGPKFTLDVKTFSQKHGKSIDKSIADAIFYEWYYGQSYFYDLLRRLANGDKHEQVESVIAFVESDPPHETRIRVLRPKVGGEVNMYWERARYEVRGFIDTYAECMKHFGMHPWRYAQEMSYLSDSELPMALNY